MFISKKYIPRRTFLRGVGVTLGLPLLDSMLPAQTPLNQTAAAPVRRFMGIWHPHGAAPGYWSPLQEGSNFEFSFITKPLEPFRDRLVLISGTDMTDAMGHHGRAGRRPRARRGAAGRRPSPQKRGQPLSGRHYRPADSQEIRAGYDPFFPATRR